MNKIFLFFLMSCFAQLSLAGVEQDTASDMISVHDYCNMLQAVPYIPQLYSEAMAADPEEYGIICTETATACDYRVVAGMEDHPMKGLSQQQREYYDYWIRQGRPQSKKISAQVSPLMMPKGHQKENGEEAQKTLEEEEQQKEQENRSRQITDTQASDLSKEQQRSLSPAIQGALPIKTNVCNRFYQAQDRLKQARKESQAATTYFDLRFRQWKISLDLKTAKQDYLTLQHQCFLAYTQWKNASTAFQQADATFQIERQYQHPLFSISLPIAMAYAAEVQNTDQVYQTLRLQTAIAAQRYRFTQQRAIQDNVMEEVNYQTLLDEAHHRVNDAALKLEKSQKEVKIMRFKKSQTLPNSEKISIPIIPPLTEKPTGLLSVDPKANGQKTSYHDQGTQISEKDLARSEDQVFLNKHARWKRLFNKIVIHVKGLKHPALTLEITQQTPHNLLASTFYDSRNEKDAKADEVRQVQDCIPASTVERNEISGLDQIVAADQQAWDLIRNEVSDVLHKQARKLVMATIIEQELLRHVLSPEWIREIASLAKNEMILAQKSCLFSKLFDSQGETTEREKWEKQKAAGIRLQEIKARERHEMKQFCIEQISLLKKEPENKERIEKKYRLNSEDGREKRLSSEPPRSSPEEKYFTEKRTRAAKKYKKIKREERPPVRRTWEDFSNQLVTSLAANFYVMMRSLYVHYITHQPIEDTEADQHARFYFAQKGELTPHNTTFWRKSIDIEWEIAAERQPLIDRMKKEAQAEGLSEEEMAARIQAWKISDRERKGKELQREWDVLLARQAAEEETHKPKTAEQIAQKEAAAQEAARQKLAYELIEQEAKEKQQRGKEKLQQAHSKKKK